MLSHGFALRQPTPCRLWRGETGPYLLDDAYLGAERPGGKAGRGSENKIPTVAAISWNEAGQPIHARIPAVNGFCSEAIADCSKQHLAPGSQVLSDGLACFRAVTTAVCVPQFRWINILLGNLKSSFNGTFHAFNSDKYAGCFFGGYCFCFSRCF